MDEFMFLNPKTLPASLPTLANGAALVLTSSMAADGADDMMRILDARYDDGTPVVNVVNWSVSCPTCERLGRKRHCKHMVRKPPHYQSYASHERLKALMSAVGSGVYQREMLNEADEPSSTPAFNHADIDYLSSSPEAIFAARVPVRQFFVAIDPNGASRNSDTAIVSCFYDAHKNGTRCVTVRHLPLSFFLFAITQVSTLPLHALLVLEGRGVLAQSSLGAFRHSAR